MTATTFPEDWPIVRLGDHFEITSSKRVFQQDWRTRGVPFYRARELVVLSERGRVDNELFIDRKMFDQFRRTYGAPSPGDFLVTGVGTLGRTYVVRDADEFYFKDGNIIWFKESKTVDSSFLNQLFQTPFVLDQVFGNSGGSTVGTYTITNANLTLIPLPRSEEQSAIAEVLNNADDLIAALERIIAKQQAIKLGVMQELLTGNTRLPGFAAPWGDVRMRDIGSSYGGLTGKTKEDFGRGAATFITFLDVINHARLIGPHLERVRVAKAENQNRVLCGDVLFNGSSETPEEVALSAAVTFEPLRTTFLNSFCFGFRIKRTDIADPVFLAYFFRARPGRALIASLAQGATRYNISRSKFMEVAPRLPGLEEQRAIVAVLNDCEAEIAAYDVRLNKARSVKQGMMQQLLTGRTRLPVAEGAA